jgi:hypothetical protein
MLVANIYLNLLNYKCIQSWTLTAQDQALLADTNGRHASPFALRNFVA